jgi:hypothetical protein
MGRRCRKYGRQPWAAVAEVGNSNNFHFHVLLSQAIDADALRNDWDHGMDDLIILPTIEDIRHFAVYMSKNFDLPADQRIDSRRFRSAPGYKPKWIDYGYATHDEAEILAQQLAGNEWPDVKSWEGNSFWCAGGYNWES